MADAVVDSRFLQTYEVVAREGGTIRREIKPEIKMAVMIPEVDITSVWNENLKES